MTAQDHTTPTRKPALPIILTVAAGIAAVAGALSLLLPEPDIVEVAAELTSQTEELVEHLGDAGAIAEVESLLLRNPVNCDPGRVRARTQVLAVPAADLEPARFVELVTEVWAEELLEVADEGGSLFVFREPPAGAQPLLARFAHGEQLAVNRIEVRGVSECLRLPDRFDRDPGNLSEVFLDQVDPERWWQR